MKKEVKISPVWSTGTGRDFNTLLMGILKTQVISYTCERYNEFFVSLTSDFTPLSMQNIHIPMERSEIPEQLFVSTGEAYKSLCRLKTGNVPGPDRIPVICQCRI